MKETLELRINYDFADLLFKKDEGKNIGSSVKVVELSKADPRYNEVPIIEKWLRQEFHKAFFFGWQIKRNYNSGELDGVPLLRVKIKVTFEPAGEECGTLYDESGACEICGNDRKQINLLTLKPGSLPVKDIARTIAGEIVVSERFVIACQQRKLHGLFFKPVLFNENLSGFFQLTASSAIELSENTIAGINPFDLSTNSNGEIYRCPEGHTIGLNILSEPHVLNDPLIRNHDFLESKQKVGVKRGLLRPEPIYFCSQGFRKMIQDEKLTGFEFEIAHIEE